MAKQQKLNIVIREKQQNAKGPGGKVVSTKSNTPIAIVGPDNEANQDIAAELVAQMNADSPQTAKTNDGTEFQVKLYEVDTLPVVNSLSLYNETMQKANQEASDNETFKKYGKQDEEILAMLTESGKLDQNQVDMIIAKQATIKAEKAAKLKAKKDAATATTADATD